MNRDADSEETAGPDLADTVCIRGSAPRRRARGDSLLGLDLQGYVITRPLSTGGMGVVYEARHSVIGQRAAVKVLRPELCGDAEHTDRFLREARALSAIKHHNVVEILNFGVMPGGGQFILMEFLEGETLSEVIARSAPMAPAQVLRIGEEILSGLSAAHELGVVHRDLKPANIILCKQASDDLIVKLVDFGLSRQIDTRAEAATADGLTGRRDDRASNVAGTPEYISPEQAWGNSVDGQADLYCLGVVMFEMLTGRLPFESTTAVELLQQHREELPPRVSSLVTDVPPALDAFVDLLLSKSPAARPSSARAARDMVRSLRNAGGDAPLRTLSAHELPIFHSRGFADTVMHLDLTRPAKSRTIPRVVAGALGMVALGILVSALASRPASVPEIPGPIVQQPVAAPEPVMILEALPSPIVAATRLVPAATVVVPARRPVSSPRARPPTRRAPAPVPASCLGDEVWRLAAREQIDGLEQVALAKISDAADPTQIAVIKGKARELTQAVSSAAGPACARVETALQTWRAGLR